MTPDETLTAAASRLRALAKAATPGPWTYVERRSKGTLELAQVEIHRPPHPDTNAPRVQLQRPESAPDAELMAAMHPIVVARLARWLGAAARTAKETGIHDRDALAVARAVLGVER